jgi:excisionase family DNA binding protein
MKPIANHEQVSPHALSRREAARYLGVSLSHLDARIATGEIRAKNSGRRVLIPVAELERFLAAEFK